MSAPIRKQTFEGIVVAVAPDGESFSADLIGHGDEFGQFEADIPTRHVEPRDRPLIVPGARFEWVIEPEAFPPFRRNRITLHRVPKWTKAGIARAKIEAEKIAKDLGITFPGEAESNP